eukprot:scaffold240967_cov17-Tisochrysis_lutea.AAC.4
MQQAQASKARPPFSTSDEVEDEDGSWGAPPQQQPVPQRAAATNDVSERPVGGSGSFVGGGMMMEGDPGPVGPMVQCPSCSRSFNEQAYQKHAKVGAVFVHFSSRTHSIQSKSHVKSASCLGFRGEA